MNVAGFEEALTSSVFVDIELGLRVRVASVPGLTLLKLIAWADRGRESYKDGADLYMLLTAYADAGNTDRLYELPAIRCLPFHGGTGTHPAPLPAAALSLRT
jgi:predicted nucleotidyltransferase